MLFYKKYDHQITPEWLEDELCNKHHTPSTIAKYIGCDTRTIYNYIEYYKINKPDFTGQLQKGQIFGYLTLIEPYRKTRYGIVWKCRCDCGNEIVKLTAKLKTGNYTSCGKCKRRKKSHKFTGCNDVSGNYLSTLRYRARKKGWDFNITAEFLWDLFKKQNGKCAISGLNIILDKTASIDRIDSFKGYTQDNVWWVHRDVNKIKADLRLDLFLELCSIITEKNKNNDIYDSARALGLQLT